MTAMNSDRCIHENIGIAQDGSDTVQCWDCGCEYVAVDALRELGSKRGHPWNGEDDDWIDGWNAAIAAAVALSEDHDG